MTLIFGTFKLLTFMEGLGQVQSTSKKLQLQQKKKSQNIKKTTHEVIIVGLR